MLPLHLLEVPRLSLAWIDTVGLVLIGVMLLLGTFRGLWWQVIRLVGLVGAVLLARALGPQLAPLLADAVPELPPRLAFGAVWLVIFVAGLAAATLLGVVGRKLLSTMKLGLLDRAGGAFVGLFTGALIHVALVAVLCQLAPADWVSHQVGGTYSEVALEAAGTQWDLIVGPEAGREIDDVFQRSREQPEPTSPRVH
jgi:uncharacterized membrane protein required for colicin V production